MVALMKYRSISSQVLVEEAELLWLSVEVINRDKNLFRVYNTAKSLLFKGSDCGVNSSLWLKIANDKELTYNVLSREGLPLATAKYINKDEWSDGFDDTWFTYPLVVKPVNGAHGDGVVMNLSDKWQVEEALTEAFEIYTRMIVQKQVEGDEYRILVFEWEVIFAARRAYPSVLGDWMSTIEELIAKENESNPLRGTGYERPLANIKIDEEMTKYLKDQWYILQTVLTLWTKVVVRSNSNIGTWGIYEDVIDIVSEEYKRVAITASKVSQLWFVWVDILTSNIWSENCNGTILEIWATCGIWWHRELTSMNTGRIMLEKLFMS